MKINDRDKKLILFVLLVAIIALPIFFFIKPTNEKIKAFDAELTSLNDRYNYLKDLSAKQPEYESEIVRLNTERDEMIKGFAGGVLQENTIMFLRDIELSENHTVHMNSIKFNDPETTVVTEASVNNQGEYVEGLTAIKDETLVLYNADYDNLKSFIDYIFNYKDKMVLSSITMELNRATNEITGTFTLDQYAISGNGKEVTPVKIPKIETGTNRLFDTMYDEDGNALTPESALGIAVEEEEEEVVTEENEEVVTE